MYGVFSDSLSFLFDACCVTGACNPYWLNDPCYAWVIDIDNYCCNLGWDTDCQYLYNYCLDGWTGTTFVREFRDKLIVYPNPAIGEFKINKQVKQIEIYDLIGRKVKSFMGNFNGQHSFDVSTLKPSIYLVKINSDFGTSSKRLIIE